MELIDKIRAEIATHMNEIDRLNTALSVIESMGGKTLKQKPMITIRGISHQEPQPEAKAKPERRPHTSNESIREGVMKALSKRSMNAGELKRDIGKALFSRSKNALSSVLHGMKAKGIIDQQVGGDKRYFLVPTKSGVSNLADELPHQEVA